MINLLPPQVKEELLREEKYRLIFILGLLVLLFLVSFSLILLSIKIYISAQAESQKIITQIEEEQFKNSQIQNIETEISSINKKLSRLSNFYQSQSNWTVFLQKISQALPASAYLTNLSLVPVAKEENLQVLLNGVCPDRDVLTEFKKNLEEQSIFQEINFSPSSWITPADFSVTFKLAI